MAEPIYLDLWIEGFTEDSMLEAWGKILDTFPESIQIAGVRGVTVLPFNWGEAAALEQGFAEGATVETALSAARDFQHSDYAYLAALCWDAWRQKTLEELSETDLDALAEAELAEESEGGDEELEQDDELPLGGKPSQSANETLSWKRVPMEVSVICLGPEFDTESGGASGSSESANPHFRIDLGLDTLFLPDEIASEEDDPEGREEAALCYRDNITQLLGFIRRMEKTLPMKSRLLWSASGEDLGERIRQAYGGS